MSGGMTAVYLLLGLGLVGGLYYALTQITARQGRLNAELTRLERLAAEVAMNAEAILERVDERIDRLNEIAAEVEAKAKTVRAAAEARVEPAPAPTVAEATQAEPNPEGAASLQKYQEARAAVFALADQGKDAGEIAQALGIPRGEVQLMLNLRGRKVTA